MEQSHQNEASLNQQIVDLQSALSEQKELVERLKKELYEAKQAAVYLAETNSKLTEEISTLRQETKKTQQIVTYRKTYQEPEYLPQTQPGESEDASAQMWLLD